MCDVIHYDYTYKEYIELYVDDEYYVKNEYEENRIISFVDNTFCKLLVSNGNELNRDFKPQIYKLIK